MATTPTRIDRTAEWQALRAHHRSLADAHLQGVIWGISSFDQSGVELGTALAQRIGPELTGDASPHPAHDSSTNALVGAYRRARGRS